MAFLNFMKKREELPSDIDLDMPPEPPKMMEEEILTEEPIDEELMPLKKTKPKKLKVKAPKEEKLPELPPLPEVGGEEFPALPPLPEEEKKPLPELAEKLPPLPEEKPEELGELPPPPQIGKEKKGFFSFLKPKKAAEKLPLPKIEEEIPAVPPLPGAGEEFPAIPPLPEKEEVLPKLEKEIPVPKLIEPLKPEPEKPIIKQKFITIDDFRQIQGNISDTKGILKGIDDFFTKLEEVKGIGDKEYLELNNSLQDIQRKIMFVDKTLFKEQSI